MIKLFKFLKPYRGFVVFVLVLTFLQSLSQLYLPTLMAELVDTGIVQGDISYVLRIGGVMLAVAAGVAVFSIAANFYASRIAMAFSKILRSKIFSRVENFSLQQFDQIGTASLVTRTTNDVMQIQQVLTVMLRMIITAPMMFMVGLLLAVTKDAQLSWIIVAMVPVLTLAIILTAKKGMPFFRSLRGKLDRLSLLLREKLNGIQAIRSFNRMDYEEKRFDDTNADFMATSIKVNRIMAILTPVVMLVLNFSMIIMIWFGSFRVSHGDLQVGDLMAFIQYAMQIMLSLVVVSMLFIMIPRASVSAERIHEILDSAPEGRDLREASQTMNRGGEIAFRDVSFRFQSAEEPVLSNLSFYTKSGEVTAIIGGTGAGKSTLVSLIPRLYDADSGSIRVNGTDIGKIAQDDLRSHIGFVSQKSFLFRGTITENIRYGKDTATDQEVKEAADMAQATEFIAEMEDGFDAVVAQGGTNLSGGQKQRLAIARALVRKPDIYIFDDSFSALDAKTRAKLQAALQKETTNATVFLVTQDVGTARGADQMIVLDQGQIAGIGKHQELMKTCEVYREMVASQRSGEESA